MGPKEEEREVREETRILVIEDDPDLRFIVKETLKKTGYEIQAAESGLEGLEALRGERFHLAIVNRDGRRGNHQGDSQDRPPDFSGGGHGLSGVAYRRTQGPDSRVDI